MGKTNVGYGGTNSPADHPHGRGENIRQKAEVGSYGGPSPRAWGKLRGEVRRVARQRTIPTGVGKTIRHHRNRYQKADHPHGRGENTVRKKRMRLGRGPSPRAWGKPLGERLLDVVERTIPTGVGKTRGRSRRARRLTDHPHGRGENSDSMATNDKCYGPSPRAWGKPSQRTLANREYRTIPTGVGKTTPLRSRWAGTSDHPHGRGENEARERGLGWCAGPSPRAWGKPGWRPLLGAGERTIPTGVGKTTLPRIADGDLADHPHGRGENTIDSVLLTQVLGPSPRAWGKPSNNASSNLNWRTIPTGVGKTRMRWEFLRCRRGRTIPTGVGKTLTFQLLTN